MVYSYQKCDGELEFRISYGRINTHVSRERNAVDWLVGCDNGDGDGVGLARWHFIVHNLIGLNFKFLEKNSIKLYII